MSLQNPRNQYKCTDCGLSMITIDRDKGITPFMIECYMTSDCEGSMHSSFYTDVPGGTPTYEWRKPTLTEYTNGPQCMKDHYDQEGLELYKIK